MDLKEKDLLIIIDRIVHADNIKVVKAPERTERFGVWHQVVLPIGDDHTAFLTMSDDALQALKAQSYKRVLR